MAMKQKLRRFDHWYRYETILRPRTLLKRIGLFIQKGRRGWNYESIWSVQDYLTTIIPEMMDEMMAEHANNGIGATIEPETGEYDYDEERWHQALLDIKNGFLAAKAISDLEPLNRPFEPAYKYEEEYAIMNHGMDVFKEHFLSLWT